MTDFLDLKPEDNDLVVVPIDTEIPTGLGFMVYKMKFLLTPSIIRSRSSNMNLFQFTNTHLNRWFNKGDSGSTVAAADSGVLTALSDEFSDQVFEKMAEKDVSPISLSLIPVTPESELATFYRYARGIQTIKHSDGESWTVDPKGGVAFYVELDAANNGFTFAYALCHTDDNFCRKIARKISKQRYDSEDWYEVENYDPGLSVVTNIKIAIYNLLYAEDSGKLEFDKTNVRFSSMSERYNVQDLTQIYKRI